MVARNVSHLVESASAAWKPSKVHGVQYLPLNADKQERTGTFILRMEPGARYPRHRHPGGEEILLLKGDMMVGERKLKPGDFLYSPPGSIHEASTQGGCMFVSILPKPIDIIGGGQPTEFDATEETPPPQPSTDPLETS